MSMLDTVRFVDRAITLLERVPGVQRAAAALARVAERRLSRRARPEPIAFGRAHAWGEGLREPQLCAYCEQERTLRNQDAPCPGPRVSAP